MTVLRHIWGDDGNPYIGFGGMTAQVPLLWKAVAKFSLDGAEPDWAKVEAGNS